MHHQQPVRHQRHLRGHGLLRLRPEPERQVRYEECAPFNGGSNAPANGSTYSSGRIKSDEKVEFRYGYIEFRARMPFADLPAGATPPNGMWPAIWLLGANAAITNGGRDDSAGWPMTGEIDIMEYSQIRENASLFPTNEAMGFNALWREYPEAGEMAAASGGWQANACSSWPNNGDAKCDGDVGGARVQWPGKTIDYHQWHTWGFLWDRTASRSTSTTCRRTAARPWAPSPRRQRDRVPPADVPHPQQRRGR